MRQPAGLATGSALLSVVLLSIFALAALQKRSPPHVAITHAQDDIV